MISPEILKWQDPARILPDDGETVLVLLEDGEVEKGSLDGFGAKRVWWYYNEAGPFTGPKVLAWAYWPEGPQHLVRSDATQDSLEADAELNARAAGCSEAEEAGR